MNTGAVFTAKYQSPVGELLLSANENALTGLWIEDQKHYGATLPNNTEENPDSPVIKAAALWLDRYFGGERPAPNELSLEPMGSDFQRMVWDILCHIPYGEVMTYGDIAKEIARRKGLGRMSAQAVGGAIGHNPISIIIPCHRVIGANGSLTGYAGGTELKQRLLSFEGVNTEVLILPPNKK